MSKKKSTSLVCEVSLLTLYIVFDVSMSGWKIVWISMDPFAKESLEVSAVKRVETARTTAVIQLALSRTVEPSVTAVG